VLGLLALGITALFPRLLSARTAALALYVLMAATAIIAEETGEHAEHQVPNTAPQAIWEVLHDHTAMAERVKALAALTALLILFSFAPNQAFRNLMMIAAACAALLALTIVMLAAHHGGVLVYQHGVGTPLFEKSLTSPAATTAPTTGASSPETPAPPAELLPVRDIDPEAAKNVSYARDIRPILEARCYDCHEPDDPDGGWVCTSVEAMKLAGEKGGPGLIPGKPDESAMVQYIRGEKQPRMPKKKKPLSEDELHLIRSWIAAGALDDSGA
jgi:mono/diheme cytochrome c family protein